MEVRAWFNGQSTYGIRVGIPNRDRYFDCKWTLIEVEIDGHFHEFALTPGFWKKCPEFRDSGGTVLRDWLQKLDKYCWTACHPPRFQLQPLDGTRFRLSPVSDGGIGACGCCG